MDENRSKWGPGIPEYTEEDILQGNELHEFCANTVAQHMQDKEGYTIEGLILESNAPVQIVANKDGKRALVLVAGAVYPHMGKISYKTKKMFSDYCISVGVAPYFASVGLMPIDTQRCEAGLALKFDGFYMNYTGNEDLSFVEEPEVEDDEYRAYCIEQLIECYLNGDFSKIYDKFDENIRLHSMWVLEPKVGKSALVDYYNGKGESLRRSRTKMVGNCVITTNEVVKKNGNVGLFTPSGRVAALIGQEIDGQTNWVFIMPKFNDENKITEISINDPAFFNFTPYYAYD